MKKVSKICKQINREVTQRDKKKELYEAKEWYTVRSLLGNQ